LSEPQAARMAAATRVSEAFSAVDLLCRMGVLEWWRWLCSWASGRRLFETPRTLEITHDGSVSLDVKAA
jgi:hypothetical protein